MGNQHVTSPEVVNSGVFDTRATARAERFVVQRRLQKTVWTTRILSLVFLLAFTVAAQAQFDYTTNDDSITITQYTGSAANVRIPSKINGLPVVSIGYGAFAWGETLCDREVVNKAG